MRTSYSQNNTYMTCPKHWEWSYEKKLKSPEEGASLFFGSAVDSAAMMMLEGKPNWEAEFKSLWHTAFGFGKRTSVYGNDDIVYGHKDFDEVLLEPDDYKEMRTCAVAGKLAKSTITDSELVDLMKDIAKTKKNPYKKFTAEMKTYFNRCSWLSLKRKGLLLLHTFHTDFYPKVTKVVATQQRADIKDTHSGDSIVGYIDMVLEIEGYDKPIIFDLKTAAMPYKQEQIELTDQLTLYAAMKSQDYNTDLVGYVVLCKNIPKESVSHCKTCGYLKKGRHKTCDNVINGARCGGEWDESVVPKPEVQVLVEKKTTKQINDLLQDAGNILLAMKQKIVYRNTQKCHNWYGGKCPFFDACHNDDTSGLVKK